MQSLERHISNQIRGVKPASAGNSQANSEWEVCVNGSRSGRGNETSAWGIIEHYHVNLHGNAVSYWRAVRSLCGGPDLLHTSVIWHLCLLAAMHISFMLSLPLVINDPFLLRAESLLEVESQRRSGSDSSGKKPLVRSTGDCSTAAPPGPPVPLPLPPLPPGDSVERMGLRLWLPFTEVIISWLMSSCRLSQRRRSKCEGKESAPPHTHMHTHNLLMEI